MSSEQFMRLPGAWDTRHWIRIPAMRHEADGQAIEAALFGMPGMRRVQVFPEKRKIRVLYDQTKLDFLMIKEQLEGIGFPLSRNWWWRRKENWFQYLDTNSKENAGATPPPCCSKPKGVDRSTRR